MPAEPVHMIKIIHVANTDWYLYNFRRTLFAYLREHGIEVVLVSPPGRYAVRLQEAGFRHIPWVVGRQSVSPLGEAAAFARLKEIYASEQPDLVHHHTIKPVLYGSLAARQTGVPAVVNSITGRGYVFLSQNARSRTLRPLVSGMYRLAFGHPNTAVTFENDLDQEFFVRGGFIPASQTHLIKGVGVDPDRFSPTDEPAEPVVVVFAGRLLWDKGVGVLVEAARLLKGKVPLRFALVGQPDPGNPSSITSKQLEEWVGEGVIEYWGWQEDTSAVYRASHIVCLPSKYGEGIPTTLLEAASCGRALVASDIPGCRMIVEDEDNGLIVPTDDPTALAAALERLARNADLRRQMGQRGRERVLAEFTQDYVNARMLDVYAGLLPKLNPHQTEKSGL